MSPNPGLPPFLVVVSLLLALSLSIMPIPGILGYARPEWVLLTLVYWTMAFPGRVGILTAFGAGLLLDVLQHQVLGQNALGFALISFVVLQIYPQLRVFPVWQQSMVIAFLVALYLLVQLWILGTTGFPPATVWYWTPILTSAIAWPVVYHLLRDLRRRWLLHLT